MTTPLRIGTRGSPLAQWQANWVAEQLRHHGREAELVEIATTGDVRQLGPVAAMGKPGVFTNELQQQLVAGSIDVAVHSLKDLPTELVKGLVLAAVPRREQVADALCTNLAPSLVELPAGARVGTGSLRRQAQLKLLRSDLLVEGIRGNVDTRLRKLDEGDYDAIVLAVAGLHRLGLESRIREVFDPPRMLPAPGQGALGIECREADDSTRATLSALDHAESRQAVDAERAMLATLHAGCSAPVGAWARVESGRLHLDGVVARVDGRQVVRARADAARADAVALGQAVAGQLLDQGAEKIVVEARSGN